MHVDLKVGVWLPVGDRPVVCHLQGPVGARKLPKARFVRPPADGSAVVLDLRGAGRLGLLRNLTLPARARGD